MSELEITKSSTIPEASSASPSASTNQLAQVTEPANATTSGGNGIAAHAAASKLPPGAAGTPRLRAVPHWSQLPPYVQEALSPRGFGADWFDSAKQSDDIRLTVLTLYVKLQGLGLWGFVGKNISTNVGNLEFECTDIQGLKAALRQRDEFTNPERSDVDWSSREERATAALHFKHFKTWPSNKVQVHIDQAGLFLRHRILTGIFSLGIATGIQAIRHGIDYAKDGYTDSRAIREQLLGQGWDPAALQGK